MKGPTLPNQGSRHYVVDIAGVRRNAKVHVVLLRKLVLALCDLVDHDHDVYFVNGMSWAKKHRVSQEVINITRRGGRFEVDCEVIVLASGNGVGRAML